MACSLVGQVTFDVEILILQLSELGLETDDDQRPVYILLVLDAVEAGSFRHCRLALIRQDKPAV